MVYKTSACGSECRGFESHPPPLQRISGNPFTYGISAFLFVFSTLCLIFTSGV